MTNCPIRAAFERLTETNYEGEFGKYPDGEYVNELQQAVWEGFHDGWKAALKDMGAYEVSQRVR